MLRAREEKLNKRSPEGWVIPRGRIRLDYHTLVAMSADPATQQMIPRRMSLIILVGWNPGIGIKGMREVLGKQVARKDLEGCFRADQTHFSIEKDDEGTNHYTLTERGNLLFHALYGNSAAYARLAAVKGAAACRKKQKARQKQRAKSKKKSRLKKKKSAASKPSSPPS